MNIEEKILIKSQKYAIFLMKLSGLLFHLKPVKKNRVEPTKNDDDEKDDLDQIEIESTKQMFKKFHVPIWNYAYCALIYVFKAYGLPISYWLDLFWPGYHSISGHPDLNLNYFQLTIMKVGLSTIFVQLLAYPFYCLWMSTSKTGFYSPVLNVDRFDECVEIICAD